MRIHDRYIVRTILSASALVGLVLIALSAFFVFIGELNDVGEGGYGVLQALWFIALNVPRGLYQLFPVIALLGALIGLGGLASGSEIVVLRASGVTMRRLAVSSLLGGLVLAVLTSALGNWIGPSGSYQAHLVKEHAKSGTVQHGGEHGIWLRDGKDYVRIRTLPSRDHMLGVTIYRGGSGQKIADMLSARSASYHDGHWILHHVNITRVAGAGVEVIHRRKQTWNPGVKPSFLRLFVVDPQNLSIGGLWRYARYMEKNHVDPGRYAQAFWNRLSAPFTVLAMVLLALPFVLGPLRSVSGGQRFFIGVMAGVAFYLLNEILSKAGHVYGLEPWVVAWGPTAVLTALAVWGLRRVS